MRASEKDIFNEFKVEELSRMHCFNSSRYSKESMSNTVSVLRFLNPHSVGGGFPSTFPPGGCRYIFAIWLPNGKEFGLPAGTGNIGGRGWSIDPGTDESTSPGAGGRIEFGKGGRG